MSLRCALSREDSRSCVEGFLKDTGGYIEDLQRIKALPDKTVFILNFGPNDPRKKKKRKMENGQKGVRFPI